MDKSQMREALKAIKDSLPKNITVTIKNEKDSTPQTITSVIKEITVGKGYKGSYTAKLETGDVISSMASENVISMIIDGNVFDKEQEKKVYNQKPIIDETVAKNLYTVFSSLKKDDLIDVASTENRFNQRFKVLTVEPVHAPFKQYKISVQKPDGNGPIATFLSRRDSGILQACTLAVSIPRQTAIETTEGEDEGNVEIGEEEDEPFNADLIAD